MPASTARRSVSSGGARIPLEMLEAMYAEYTSRFSRSDGGVCLSAVLSERSYQ